MEERDGFPPGVPCWIDTQQPDRQAALRFYSGLFGWSFHDHMPAGSRSCDVATLRGRDVAAIGSGPGSDSVTWTTYIGVESADDAVRSAERAGGAVVAPPFDAGHAGRLAMLTDPTGAAFSVWQPKRRKGAGVVNEPGTWNWSLLHTPDPERAAAFYGAVFGWETDLDGDDGPKLVRRPGYADFLERFDPDLRRRHAEHGAPPGFSDAVAWIVLDDEAAHWAVTFSVADADAVAAAADGLGGAVIGAPFDTEWTREAVIADPGGATFTASAFRPPT